MKAVVAVALALGLSGQLRADWNDLKPGMDARAAVQCVGTPILQSEGRAASALWNYDSGGFVLFAAGRVTYWEAPKIKPLAPIPSSAPAQVHAPARSKPTKPAATVLAKS